jgi:peptide deformylase
MPHWENRILTYPDDEALLRRPAKKVQNVREALINVQHMKRLALEWERNNPGERCEGLAATQVGISQRIIILRHTDDVEPQRDEYLCRQLHTFANTDGVCPVCGEEAQMSRPTAEYRKWKIIKGQNFDPFGHVLINPKYIGSDGVFEWTEGCMSVPGLLADTIRPKLSQFSYYDLSGKCHRQQAAEAASGAIVHEMDHLSGVLMIDNAIKVVKQTGLVEALL